MKNVGIWIVKILLGLTGLTLFYGGFMWAFMPESNLESYQIVSNSILGLNMIKSDIGAPLMAMGFLQIWFVFGKRELFLPVVIIGLCYFIVRSVSFFIDGSDPLIISGIVMEIVVPLLNVALYRLTQKA